MTHFPTRRMALTLAVAAGVTLAMAAPAVAKVSEQQKLVDESTETLKAFLNDKEMSWLRANIGKSKAVIIAPSVVKAGFIFGGSGGQGVVLARGRDGKWAGPAFYKLGTASIGFQAGVSDSAMVALVMNQKALDSLMAGSFKLGADVSVAAGPVGGGAKSNLKADVIAYSKSKGLYGGVNFSGTGIATNNNWSEQFYGVKPLTPIDILVKRTVKPGTAAPLVAVLDGK
ncbi:MAG: lipid-binding SYLF domain-containing protein [Polymorphobacter sp.]